jgi:hypothetical protein
MSPAIAASATGLVAAANTGAETDKSRQATAKVTDLKRIIKFLLLKYQN